MAATFRRRVPATLPALDPYDIAHLAGGPRRVAETALAGLRDRGLVTVRGPRVRARGDDAEPAGGDAAEHPVELALIALCPRGRSVADVLAAVAQAPETAKIGLRLVSYGLLTRRRRLTQAGRRRLEAARQEATLPAYVFEGPAALPDRLFRTTVTSASSVPSGLGKTLIRMAKALERESDSDPLGGFHSHADSDGGSDAGHSCGSGGGEY
jgi:hypothetical protein